MMMSDAFRIIERLFKQKNLFLLAVPEVAGTGNQTSPESGHELSEKGQHSGPPDHETGRRGPCQAPLIQLLYRLSIPSFLGSSYKMTYN